MKSILVLLLTLTLAVSVVQSQTADAYVTQGRAFLAAHDLTNADARFALAVATTPNHVEGNVFRAVTRLLTLQNRPAGAALLDRLGVAATNRNVYDWTADLARDTNGVPLAPANFSAAELTAFIRTNVVPEIKAAESNLAVVTDSAFLLNLTSNETAALAVTVDYGDIRLLRAALRLAEYVGYTLYSWNLDVQLATIRAYAVADAGTPEAFLQAHASFLTLANTNDLGLARQAFTNAASLYVSASDFIRNRATNVTRLFNLDPAETQTEADFRATLADLVQSLNGWVAFQINPAMSVNLSNHFSGRTSLRALFPELSGEKVVAGTLPDETFGGVVGGLSAAEIENEAGTVVPFVSKLGRPVAPGNNTLTIPLRGLDAGVYQLFGSTNLQNWQPLGPIIMQQGAGSFTDQVTGKSRQYYRILDRSSEIAFLGTVRGLVTRSPITNAQALVQMYYPFFTSLYQVVDANGSYLLTLPDIGFNSFWYQVSISAPGYASAVYFYDQKHFARSTYLVPTGYVQPNDPFANRTVLVGRTNSVLAANVGATRETNEPNHNGGSGGNSLWWSWTAPVGGNVVIDTIGSDFPTVLAVYTGNTLVALAPIASDDSGTSNAGCKVSFVATANTTYQIAVDGNSFSTGVIQLNLRQ